MEYVIFVFIFLVFFNVLKCICINFEMGNKYYIGAKGWFNYIIYFIEE